jgi:hypothetical protein
MTLDDLTVPLRALRLLAVDFGHLPAPDVDVSRVFPEWLRLSFHGTSGETGRVRAVAHRPGDRSGRGRLRHAERRPHPRAEG